MPPTSPASSTASTVSLPSLRQVDGVACWLEGVSPLSAPAAAPAQTSAGENKGGAAQGAGQGQVNEGAPASVGSVKSPRRSIAGDDEVDELGSEGSGEGVVGIGAGVSLAAVGAKGGRAKPVRACGPCKLYHTSCDHSRPCQRCIHRGKEAQCVDVPSRRGRNRLPAARAQHAAAAARATQPSPGLAAYDAQRAHAGGPTRPHPNQFNPARYHSTALNGPPIGHDSPDKVKPFVHREARMRPKPYEYHPQLGAAQPAYSQPYRFPATADEHLHQPQQRSGAISSPGLNYATTRAAAPSRSSSAGSSSYQSQATTVSSASFSSAAKPFAHVAPQPQRFARMDQLAFQAMRAAEHERHPANATAHVSEGWVATSAFPTCHR